MIHWWAQHPSIWEAFGGLSQRTLPKGGGQKDSWTFPGGIWVPYKEGIWVARVEGSKGGFPVGA